MLITWKRWSLEKNPETLFICVAWGITSWWNQPSQSSTSLEIRRNILKIRVMVPREMLLLCTYSVKKRRKHAYQQRALEKNVSRMCKKPGCPLGHPWLFIYGLVFDYLWVKGAPIANFFSSFLDRNVPQGQKWCSKNFQVGHVIMGSTGVKIRFSKFKFCHQDSWPWVTPLTTFNTNEFGIKLKLRR